MSLLRHASPAVSLTLSRDLVRSLKRGDPWIFADALTGRPPAPAGSMAVLHDGRGRPVAAGLYDPAPSLCFRACTVEDGLALDDAWAGGRLARALALRKALLGPETTGYRLLNGEGDGVPGLVCDVYAETAVLRLDGDGPAGFWNAPEIARWLAQAAGVTTVIERARGGDGGRALLGAPPAEPVTFLENGVWFTTDVLRGQKTGFFLDQRENRERVRHLARGRRVLNLFGYTGGFSVQAGLGGAEQVTTVDLANPAIEAAQAHWQLNGLPHRGHEAVAGDVFTFLEDAARAGRRWDLVIADPPSFAPNQASVPQARAAYRRLIAAASAATEPDGLLAAASCSSHIAAPEFLDLCEEGVGAARRRAAVLAVHGQPFDHPSPLALPQFRYLKFVLLRVE
jgi:23S rRNA (cytosine1962-C5)-methyltransferase